jgi:hypothetical protein
LPDTDAAKEWAPASAGEASMARTCATLLFTCFCSSPPHSSVVMAALSYPLCSV